MTSSRGPPLSDYIKSSSKIWFSYLPKFKSFNVGLMGVNGASIGGVLHLRSTSEQALEVNRIEIKFIGEETKGWVEPINNGFPINSGFENEGNFERICEISADVWKSNNFKKVTGWDISFNIPIPDHLPPSMTYLGKDNNNWFVRYKLMAIIYRKFSKPLSRTGHQLTSAKAISVKHNLIRYHLQPVVNSPTTLSNNSSRYLGFIIHFNKTTYNLGDTIKISMKLFLYNPETRFKKIDIHVKECFNYDNKEKSYDIGKKIIKGGDDTLRRENHHEWNATLSLPLPLGQNGNKILLCDIDGKNSIRIQHKVVFKFKISKINKNLFGDIEDIEAEKQIFVRNFVNEEMRAELDSALSTNPLLQDDRMTQTRSARYSIPPQYLTNPQRSSVTSQRPNPQRSSVTSQRPNPQRSSVTSQRPNSQLINRRISNQNIPEHLTNPHPSQRSSVTFQRPSSQLIGRGLSGQNILEQSSINQPLPSYNEPSSLPLTPENLALATYHPLSSLTGPPSYVTYDEISQNTRASMVSTSSSSGTTCNGSFTSSEFFNDESDFSDHNEYDDDNSEVSEVSEVSDGSEVSDVSDVSEFSEGSEGSDGIELNF